jgi:3-hydroxybutyryl-CoA dehydrogenase
LHQNTEPSPLVQKLVQNGDYGVKGASRKGFYDWDEAAIAREQRRYQVALAKAMQILRDEEDAQDAEDSAEANPG